MLKFKTSCAVLAYLSSNLLNEVGLSLFRYFEVGLRVCDIVIKKFTFAISSSDEFLSIACCLNLLHTKNTAKGANLWHLLDVQKAKKASASGGFRLPNPPPGALPLDSRWGLRPQTPVIGSRYRARHGPHTFWQLPAPMTAPINHTGPSPRMHSPDGAASARKHTSDYSLLLSLSTLKG